MEPALHNLKIDRPSKIQSLSFQEVLSGRNVVIADQTGGFVKHNHETITHWRCVAGSGKTLAYLLPILQRLLTLQRNQRLPPAAPYHPYVVVLTPTSELAW